MIGQAFGTRSIQDLLPFARQLTKAQTPTEAKAVRPPVEARQSNVGAGERSIQVAQLESLKFAFAATLAYLPTEENATRDDVYEARRLIDELIAAAPLNTVEARPMSFPPRLGPRCGRC